MFASYTSVNNPRRGQKHISLLQQLAFIAHFHIERAFQNYGHLLNRMAV